MLVYFHLKCYLVDGSERNHTYEFQAKSPDAALDYAQKLADTIKTSLEQGRSLPMPNPLTYYAPGQVRYVEMGITGEIEEWLQKYKLKEKLDRKLGFIKD